MKETYLSTS